jgi:hypothetical protein
VDVRREAREAYVNEAVAWAFVKTAPFLDNRREIDPVEYNVFRNCYSNVVKDCWNDIEG